MLLPAVWTNFIALYENKADLAQFMSEELISNAPIIKIIVVAGEFLEEKEVRCQSAAIDVTLLKSNHKEAGTRLVLHAAHSAVDNVVVSSRDTNALLLWYRTFRVLFVNKRG